MSRSVFSDLDGMQVAVTGGCGGIGLALCTWLTDCGATVYALDLKRVDGQYARFIETDVTLGPSIAGAADQVVKAAGRVDGLVTAAGVGENDVAAEDMDPSLFDRVIDVNLRGVFLTCQAFGRHMLERGAGSIVNIASMSGAHVVNVPQRQCAYNSSKAAVVALTRSLALERGHPRWPIRDSARDRGNHRILIERGCRVLPRDRGPGRRRLLARLSSASWKWRYKHVHRDARPDSSDNGDWLVATPEVVHRANGRSIADDLHEEY